MKKEATKKNKLWIVIVAAAVVLLAVAGVVLGFMLGGDKPQAPQGPTEGRPELYGTLIVLPLQKILKPAFLPVSRVRTACTMCALPTTASRWKRWLPTVS